MTTHGFAMIEIPGPDHHKITILDAILDAPTLSCGRIALAPALIEHAITYVWGTAPDHSAGTTLRQFQELIQHRYYPDLYRQALVLEADMDRVPELAETIRHALAADTQLTR
ncbi:hypothetical protein [Kitasatospora cheerisanensis]|uniref:Uncharacterized protein n=1 Tax=Kitasatospora cheerisanensis KCTC 2395 TaxID=1348663 RepID=A0A066YWX7_9ACTN|nr:hypothetical protein [Kitasatospora cheerisanensis]KDN85697.1 hypothetical protein KCH_25250 [Kitasatospora cheerisanensis KCTC 2395]